MPSFLGRFIGLSFQTERLMMNIIGLINSTFDWSPLKWTNELEQIQNISLSYSTLILSTIGEDTIKTVLSWIVITRIIIAHVYTFSYLTNIYPILTWSRPNLLLPWLILSFFKNVVLEMIVLAVCLLYWYDKRFSLAIFLEFLLVKIVPLILATYNWYSNSCLFLELRRTEKMMKLKKALRSDTNFVTSRLYMKLADSKYRTRSLTTLLSYESYETFDTQDSISRILDDTDLTPAQKTTKILGLNQQDILDARARRNEREVHRRLTEVDDRLFPVRSQIPQSFLMFDDEYEEQLQSLLKQDDENVVEDSEIKETPSKLEESPKETTVETPPEVTEKPAEETQLNHPEEAEALNKIEEESNDLQTKEMKQKEHCSSCSKDFEADSSSMQKRNCTWLSETKKDEENNCSLIKMQSLFNCNCLMDENLFKDIKEHCCLPGIELKTSTPKGSPESERKKANLHSDDVIEVNESTSVPLMENLSNNDVKILENIKENPYLEKLVTEEKLTRDEDELKNIKHDSGVKTIVVEENLKQKVRQMTEQIKILLNNFQDDPYLRGLIIEKESVKQTKDENVSIGVQSLSEMVKDMKTANPVENFEMLTTIDLEESKDGLLKTMHPMRSTVLSDINSTERSESYKTRVEENRLKVNAPEYSFGDTNIPRFYKNSMKVFDGCYEKDFASNSELQCVLRQLEKKKWNPFAGQSNLEALLQRNDEINQSAVRALRNVSPPTKDCEKTDRSKISSKSQKLAPVVPIKSSYTQTGFVRPPLKAFNNADSKNWKKVSLKRKRLKDQISVSSINDHHDGKIKPRHFPNTQNEKAIRQSDDRKKPNLLNSTSNKSVCECKIQQLEAKCSPSSENKKDRRRSSPKVVNFGTVTLAQVSRPSEFNASANRKKPPICPKKVKKETSQNALPRITPMIKKLQESKRSKIKNRVESLDDKEMRALKVYNEATLLKDKKQLDAKRKSSSNKTIMDLLPKESKHRTHPRKSNSKKKLNQDAESIADKDLDKENLSVDISVELESSSTARSSKTLDESAKASNESYICSKLSKVNRVTDRLLDRLFTIQKQNQRKNRLVEQDARKQFSKYSKPKQMVDEEVVSASSSKKLEGMQKGRDLERTPAKEDIRGQFTDTADLSRMQPLSAVEVDKDTKDSKTEPAHLLLTIKSSVNHDVVSTWSSSTIDKSEEAHIEELPRTMDQPRTTVIVEDVTKEEFKVQEETPPLQQNEIEPVAEENSVDVSEPSNDDGSRRRNNYADFIRNIDVSQLAHGVVLSNPNAPRSKNPRQRGIVDDATSRLLHTAFSYHSMDSIWDYDEDDFTVNDVMNERSLNALDEDFVCQASNDAVDVFADVNLENALPGLFAGSQNLDAQEENCDLFIATVDEEDLTNEGFRSNNVFAIVDRFLRNFDVRNFVLENVDPRFRALQGISVENDGEEIREDTEENDVIEEEDEEEDSEDDRTLRFIKEDVFTDIKFPVVINWSDSLVASNEDPEEMNLRIRDAGIGNVELLPLEGVTKLEEDVKLRSEEMKNIEQPVFFAKLESSSRLEELKRDGGNVYSEQRFETKIEEDYGKSGNISSDELAFRTYQIMRYFESEDSLSETESEDDEENIGKNRKLEITKNTDRNDQLINFKEEAGVILIEERVMTRNIEEIVKGFQQININDKNDETVLLDESMELEELQISNIDTRPIDSIEKEEKMILIEESVEIEEMNEIQSIRNVQDDENDEEKQEIVESIEAVSPLTIILFWIIGFFFYVESWWQKMISTRNSGSTSSFNPFQIHTAPMWTTKLLEEIEEEEEDLFLQEELMNFEVEEDLRLKKQRSRMDLTMDQIPSGIIEFGNDSEEMEEAMFSENVEIPSFSNSDEEKTRLNLSSDEIIFPTENEKPRDLRANEEEIKTFRFEEADDSSSTKSFFEHSEETKLFLDDRLNCPRAEVNIDDEEPCKEEIPKNDEKNEDEILLKSETIAEGKVEEAEGSTEKTPKVLEPNLQIVDSFDSTYSKISVTSRCTISDLNGSSLEEFEEHFNS